MSVVNEVMNLDRNSEVQRMLKAAGLNCTKVQWEDTARTKGSCWGPNITDQTLAVDGQSCPVIRKPNFLDQTADYPIEHFMLNVGNEKGERTQMISLREYLQNIEKYIDCSVKGAKGLYLERDEKLMTSSQACILPLNKGNCEFNVQLHNYQYSATNPALLVIVASPHGTSAQLLTERQQKIYFNNAGQRANYIAERLEDDRKRRGVNLTDPMTQEEKEKQALFIFHVPLKKKETFRGVMKGYTIEYDSYGTGPLTMGVSSNYVPTSQFLDEEEEDCCFGDGIFEPESLVYQSNTRSRTRGMDRAQLSVGSNQGEWKGTPSSFTIERDTRFAIRATIQYYYVTDTSSISEGYMTEITENVNKVLNRVSNKDKGSLVTETTDRTTEPQLPPQKPKINYNEIRGTGLFSF